MYYVSDKRDAMLWDKLLSWSFLFKIDPLHVGKTR